MEESQASGRDDVVINTSMQFDLTYHYVTYFMGYAVFTTITLGGFIFGYLFMEFTGPADCDFDAVDSSAKSEAL